MFEEFNGWMDIKRKGKSKGKQILVAEFTLSSGEIKRYGSNALDNLLKCPPQNFTNADRELVDFAQRSKTGVTLSR
tara:strand:+ start:1448 stop:1675 length:228 start_codon:yes stop_codon:yes gene_type:complete